jgi:hypothetical protein
MQGKRMHENAAKQAHAKAGTGSEGTRMLEGRAKHCSEGSATHFESAYAKQRIKKKLD